MQKELKLLPNQFVKISIGLIIIGLAILILPLFSSGELLLSRHTWVILSKSIIVTAMLLIAISKSKVEDERTLRIRLYAFTATFLWGTSVAVLDAITGVVSGEGFLASTSVLDHSFSLFFFYFIYLNFLKLSK
ncbi:hypothetical protein [Persicobacter diffluens]|uniref:Uncharacterized protein n=1 Tax=Persicobacter diffluens TaxID=981 RepID=A0AAN5ANP5_9BACT|nr:hypothetical protein PEDI_55590 [Persicobacter diffluens]